ncbi:MAG TPA: DUF4340 domain-containing protein [Anaerohalosphaeraceae bacterium]|nr:DUF4340 domain-containing protein [Anaerohalosphaeraceae bacterium]HOL89561.1 DUF4340 domain-containing protein [Anaerohalosphaeraceae bacterium]HPP57309.1 DUF4340 domain-containing protein [Anaerohalosphaeraceae bacterium]
MNDKKVAILAIVAVLAAAGAMLSSRLSRNYTPPKVTIFPLIEGLDIDRIQTIVIGAKSADGPIHLDRSDKAFTVREKDGYPASVSKVNSLISDCLDIRITSDALITSNPANHAQIGVTEDTARWHVEFLGADQKLITGLLVSESKTEGEQSRPVSAVRLMKSPNVYRLADEPYISTRAMDYIDAQILQAEREKILRVSVTDPNQRTYTLTAQPDSSDLVLDPLPEGKQIRQANAKTTFSALTYLRADDVSAASKLPDLKFSNTYVCEVKNYLVYTVRLAEQDGKYYIRLSARYTGPEPQVQQEAESEEKLREREALFLARDTAESFTAKHDGWVYIIPSYKAQEMIRPLQDLIEDKPAAPAASEVPAADKSASEKPAESAG